MKIFAVPAAAALLLALGAFAAPGHAQVTLQPAGVDLGVGLGVGRGGGVRHQRDGVGAAVLVAWRVRALAPGAAVVGLVASAQGVLASNDLCVQHPTLGCAPNYPGVQSLGVLAGWEGRRGPRAAAVRVLAGPAVFRSEERATGLGLQGRLDFTTPTVARVALVAWGQGGLVPRLRGDTYRVASFGLGLRAR